MREFQLTDTEATRRCFTELEAWTLPDIPRDYATFLATPLPVEFLEFVETKPTLGEEVGSDA